MKQVPQKRVTVPGVQAIPPNPYLVEGLGVGLMLDAQALPFSAQARAAAELLGIDLLHAAGEGRLLLAYDPAREADARPAAVL